MEDNYVDVRHDNKFKDNIKVETEGFRGTSKFALKLKTMPSLDNENAKKAIKNVLEEYDFYNKQGDYTLFAKIKRNYTGGFTTTRENTINYKLINNSNDKIVFDEDIESKGETKLPWHK